MRQLYYILQTLLRGRGGNFVKLVSLTLGLLAGVLLFSQIVYELNYDTCYKDSERLALFCYRTVSPEGEVDEWDYTAFRPAAAALAESLPDLVESATPILSAGFSQNRLYVGDMMLDDAQVLYADTLYFRTLGIEVLKGDPQYLAQDGNAFLSRSMARRMFGSEDPVGKTFNVDKMQDVTVRGVYEDLPGNVSVPGDVMISLPTAEKSYGQGTWTSNDMYFVYLRLRRAADVDEVNRRVNEVVGRYTDINHYYGDNRLECRVMPAADLYLSSPDSVRRVVLLFVLGFSIFFVSGMNYVLAAIASIGRRAKMVGVHKCCGADSTHVMGMFLWETGLMMLAAIVLDIVLMHLFGDLIEDTLGLASVGELFTWQTLWVPLATVVVLFVIAGVLPGRMFARIPVTQVFRRYTDDKRSWKRGLLFVQFMGVAFIAGLLLTSVYQFHDLMTRDLGFDDHGLVVGTATGIYGMTFHSMEEYLATPEHLADDIRRQPYVQAVGRSVQSMLMHYSTRPVYGTGDKHVVVHYQYYAKGLPEVVGLKLVEGRLPESEGECVVNEELVRQLNWSGQVIGREILTTSFQESEPAKVVGVIRDVRNMGYFSAQTCVAFILNPANGIAFHVRLKEPTHDNLLRLNEFVKQTYPQMGLTFLSYEQVRRDNNESVLRFRNTVYMASACIVLIVLMGLIGYVSDETQRRSKEIAVRKVNGAEASDILRMMSAGILRVAVGAVLIGIAAAWYVSGIWMEQFADCAVLSPLWFALVGLLLLVLIVLVVVVKAWHIANENPVKSIKSE
ncbi:MAG: ABC transporter permease [Bacteroides sp.]|nr:ABC transporter permease [Bacteroides sp.]